MAIDTISNGRWKTLYSSRTILWSIDYEIYWVHKLFSWKGMCHVRIGASRTPIIWLRGRVRCTVNIPGSKPDTQRSQVLGAIVLEIWGPNKEYIDGEICLKFKVVANILMREKVGFDSNMWIKPISASMRLFEAWVVKFYAKILTVQWCYPNYSQWI